MLKWTRLMRTVNVWRRTTPCAKTTEREREAEDQIMEQVNKYTRNGGRRYCRVFTWLSEIESVESKVENEMLSVKMHLGENDHMEPSQVWR